MVFGKKNLGNYLSKRNLLEREICKSFISECKSIEELDWRINQPLTSFPGALTRFSQLFNLTVDLHFVSSNSLHEMAQICRDLNKLNVDNYFQDVPGLISLIDAQRNLKFVLFKFSFNIKKEIYEGLSNALAKKDTINSLILRGSVGVISHSFLTSLNNLKYLTIHYECENCEAIKELQKWLGNSKFPDLQSLDIGNDLLCFKELAMSIEKTKGNIFDITAYTSNKSAENTGKLLKAISIHCPKIDYLNYKSWTSLLMNCRNLVCLFLHSLNKNDDIGDELLNILTKFSPESLTEIKVSGYWKYSIDTFENFFKSYKGRESLHFDIIDDYDGEHITIGHINIVYKYYIEGIILCSNLLNYVRLKA
ncbi:uncharacterized protein OCT59_015481 [Rhizophagus irregularis]|uniref:RNI-like protein n=2 Tax=Rhizophagus irregularis TaxID=588596 RepID=A0A015KVK9_RHIIW|nr:hypothetical protein GLOIN_2v1475247 [Rhizophagus irregularis DAOM 181602=DAOM 197198]EXX71614.1 hypothetical protein RirG_076940 [Rhizophagus irregularis DAOM 197198w]UZO23137.1 hypothetical protein OCT59_015481 [Rhizophagus irregularis]POG75701.1 hypothetical protein GLOIN_2v1475247 [Rhizophagus irregularis DAOM 181602=DAOM 197198]CAG8701009.1 1779_t:CDS:1 [Rhizophagus irregularis]GET57468.1 hypothetical protein GLOIN_2v1475247 [Rhizophagus irregularis DAOM 181602=DAOM 197198]|eukprot:XP_025182567.1 hypothetical protein GLOIN_2v1475247 [Rhizophagus irregularis DAOM 181602=DAOM 197198]